MKKRMREWVEKGWGAARLRWWLLRASRPPGWHLVTRLRGWACERVLEHRRVLGVMVVVLIVVIAWAVVDARWEWLRGIEEGKESHSTTIRNMGLLVGGVIALGIAIWRGWVANRQAGTAEADLLNKRYQEGAAMLGSAVLAVRLAGIYALRRLAEEHPAEYHQRVMRSLCAFVRHPTTDQSVDRAGGVCEDVQIAMREIAVCHDAQINTEVACGLDLTGADLRSASLHSVNLSSARIPTAMLAAVVPRVQQIDPQERSSGRVREAVEAVVQQVPPLELAERAWVNLTLADLTAASLQHAKLRRTMLFGSDFSGANFTGADLSGAEFESVPRAPGGIGATKGLTQAQLDSAVCEPENPPNLEGLVDPVTGEPLRPPPRGLDGKPHPKRDDVDA